jgi:hypothetical protein
MSMRFMILLVRSDSGEFGFPDVIAGDVLMRMLR